MPGARTTFRGRPFLPKYNPANTPGCTDFVAWESILASGRSSAYAAETLIEVYDGAIVAHDIALATSLEAELWIASDSYIQAFVKKLKIEFIEPQTIVMGAIKYFVDALRNRYRKNGKARRDYEHLRRGFFRTLKNRTRDALRKEYRAFKRRIGETRSRASALATLDVAEREALRDLDVEVLAVTEGPILRGIVVGLRAGLTWREIGEPLGLSEDAARKRLARMIRRWRDRNDRP